MSVDQRDRSADALFREYGEQVYNLAYRITGSQFDAAIVEKFTASLAGRDMEEWLEKEIKVSALKRNLSVS